MMPCLFYVHFLGSIPILPNTAKVILLMCYVLLLENIIFLKPWGKLESFKIFQPKLSALGNIPISGFSIYDLASWEN